MHQPETGDAEDWGPVASWGKYWDRVFLGFMGVPAGIAGPHCPRRPRPGCGSIRAAPVDGQTQAQLREGG